MPPVPADSPHTESSYEQLPTFMPEAEIKNTPILNAKQTEGESIRTSFVDSLGRTREAHPLATEVIVTDEIADGASERFTYLDSALTHIDADLATAEWQISHADEYEESVYSPLDEAFLERIKEKVREQLGRITREEKFTEVVETTKKTLFGSKTVKNQVESTRQVLQEGYVHDALGPSTLASLKYPLEYKEFTYDDNTKKLLSHEEVIAKESELTISRVEELLLSEERRYDSHNFGTRLPLLANRLAKEGIAVESLTLETLYQLVPELQPVQDNVEVSRGIIHKGDVSTLLKNTAYKLMELGPQKDMVSALFYSDGDIQGIMQRYKRTQSLENIVWGRSIGTWKEPDVLEQEMKATIEQFFDDKVLADTLVFHGTPALPRIIESGKLMPAHLMQKIGKEFTYFTMRNQSGMIDGSRGVHWAGKHGSAYFADGHSTLEGYLPDKELTKGAMAGGTVAIRVGDALTQAPFIEDERISTDDRRDSRHRSVSSAVVELTENGFQKVASRLLNELPTKDTVFAAAIGNRTNDELFDYSFPLEDLLFEVNEHEAALVLKGLEEAGWSDEMINERVVYIAQALDRKQQTKIADDELAGRALNSPRYPRSFVAGVRAFTF